MCRCIFNTIKTSGHSSLEKYTSHFTERVQKGYEEYYCVRGKLETEQNFNILTLTLMAITAFLSRFPGLLNRGPRGPASARTSFSFHHLLTNWFQLPVHRVILLFYVHSIQTVDSQGRPWSPDIFDRLFTQVHFFFWLCGRVEGQYATIRLIWNKVIDVTRYYEKTFVSTWIPIKHI